MTRFYFDIRENGTLVKDDEGMDLPDLAAIELEAAKSAAEIAKEVLPGSDLRSVTIDVRDTNGNHVLSATATLEISRRTARDGNGSDRSGNEP